MTSTSPKAVVARFWEMYNGPDTILQTADLGAEDCEHHQAALFGPPAHYVGRKPQIERIRMVAAALSDCCVTPLQIVADGEDVACRYAWTATWRVPLARFAAGAKLQMEALCFFTVRDGLIVRINDGPGAITAHAEG
ncbi:MAG: nuclear transport factor 2 family protein [Dehalococcoidia bacterium]|nr:nuclear transport factor 2 family protein [Dehalococcoidia bacterium]